MRSPQSQEVSNKKGEKGNRRRNVYGSQVRRWWEENELPLSPSCTRYFSSPTEETSDSISLKGIDMSIPTMAQLQHVQSSAQTNSASGVGSRDIVPPTQTQTQARPGPLPRRLPRKSILKSQRPSLQLNNSLRPLPESITDRFPLELVKLVLHWVVALGSNVPSSPIDYPMRPPNPTLIACSLVCRAWVPLCRTHYTPRLTVTPSNASQFLDLVNGETSGHLTIGQSIKHLVVQKQENVVDHFFLVGTNGTGMSNNRGPTSPGGCSRSSSISSASSSASSDSSASGLRSPYRDTSSPASSSSSLTSQSSSTSLRKPGYDLTDILSVATTRLPSIIKLTLQKAYNQTSQIASYIASFADLEELELRSFEFGTFSDLAAVISAQQGLKRLALTDIAWGPPSSEDSDHGHRPPPNLQTLELFMAHQSHLFEWMFKAPSTEPYTPKISSVDIGGIMQLEDAIAVSRFLRKLGPHLKHLSLYSPSRISQVNLVHNTNLESLTISHLQIAPPSPLPDSRPRSDAVCTILSQLCAPNLTRISLQLIITDPDSFSCIDWKKVSEMLRQPRFRKLEVMEFKMSPRWGKWMMAMVGREVPELVESGILTFGG